MAGGAGKTGPANNHPSHSSSARLAIYYAGSLKTLKHLLHEDDVDTSQVLIINNNKQHEK